MTKTVVNFTKMQGLGNDFIILDLAEFKKIENNIDTVIPKICNRNFGIGADGVIVVNDKENESDTDIAWYFYNSDGSIAQMCGNGMRCFARYIYDKGILNKKKSFSVSTKAGVIVPEIISDSLVKVNMGKPVLDSKKIPFTPEDNLNYEIELWSKKFILNAVSMGNPHCVIFTDEDTKTLAKDYGSDIELSDLFPEKTNVEFVKIISKEEIILDVWERGCGITLACGTGACASVVAGILNGLLSNKVLVHLPGGDLSIEWNGSISDPSYDVFMQGPAEYSFIGSFEA